MKKFAKRLASVLLSAAIAGGCLVSSSAQGIKYGDADGNEKVNSSDALAVLLHSIEKETLTGDRLKAADVNADGNVNSSDALDILFYSVGKIDRFSAEKTVVIPSTDKEILEAYAQAVKKARAEVPSYRIKSTTTAKDVNVKITDALGLLGMAGSSAKEMEQEMKDEILAENGTYQTICKQGSSMAISNLPPECTLTDPSLLAGIKSETLANGNIKIEIRFKDEKNPKAGSPLCKGLGIAAYDEVLKELEESAEIEEGISVKIKLDELSYKNCSIICELNPATGEFASLEINTDMYTDTSMSMVVGIRTAFTESINSVYTDFGY